MLAYATATYEKVISCILCSPLALYIHPVEFVTVLPASFPAHTFLVYLISFCLVWIFILCLFLQPACKSKPVTVRVSLYRRETFSPRCQITLYFSLSLSLSLFFFLNKCI